MCANDYIAQGAIMELQKRGYHIPNDIAVTGFDNIDFGQNLIPTLSTVNQDFQQMGKQAALLLIDLLHEKKSLPCFPSLPSL